MDKVKKKASLSNVLAALAALGLIGYFIYKVVECNANKNKGDIQHEAVKQQLNCNLLDAIITNDDEKFNKLDDKINKGEITVDFNREDLSEFFDDEDLEWETGGGTIYKRNIKAYKGLRNKYKPFLIRNFELKQKFKAESEYEVISKKIVESNGHKYVYINYPENSTSLRDYQLSLSKKEDPLCYVEMDETGALGKEICTELKSIDKVIIPELKSTFDELEFDEPITDVDKCYLNFDVYQSRESCDFGDILRRTLVDVVGLLAKMAGAVAKVALIEGLKTALAVGKKVSEETGLNKFTNPFDNFTNPFDNLLEGFGEFGKYIKYGCMILVVIIILVVIYKMSKK